MWVLGRNWLRYSRALSVGHIVKLPISYHPKCKDLDVSYRRGSFTRISHRGLFREEVQHIYFLAENLLHAIKLLTHVVPCLYTLKWCNTHNKQRDHTMQQVVTY